MGWLTEAEATLRRTHYPAWVLLKVIFYLALGTAIWHAWNAPELDFRYMRM